MLGIINNTRWADYAMLHAPETTVFRALMTADDTPPMNIENTELCITVGVMVISVVYRYRSGLPLRLGKKATNYGIVHLLRPCHDTSNRIREHLDNQRRIKTRI